jgi:hypothetical protein
MNMKGVERLLVVTAIAATALASGTPAGAQVVFCSHGTSAQVEDVSVLANPARYFGWGLSLEILGTNSTWVHLPVTSLFGAKTRYLALVFESAATQGVAVNRVDVWDGATKIKQFDVSWTGPRAEVLDLGADHAFGSLGISARVVTDPDTADHSITFSTACAEYHF